MMRERLIYSLYACILLALVALSASLSACKTTPEPRGEDAQKPLERPVEPRPVEVRFVLTDDVATDLSEPVTGQMRGAIFHTSDVGAFGPKKGAEAVAKMEPQAVDFGDPDTLTWSTPPLPPGEYTFLGFVDLDENSPDGPDDGDVVTRPGTNRFDPSDLNGPLEVRFDYIKGSTIFG
jgi:hypothetical protein